MIRCGGNIPRSRQLDWSNWYDIPRFLESRRSTPTISSPGCALAEQLARHFTQPTRVIIAGQSSSLTRVSFAPQSSMPSELRHSRSGVSMLRHCR
jgi:hypothetical protein